MANLHIKKIIQMPDRNNRKNITDNCTQYSRQSNMDSASASISSSQSFKNYIQNLSEQIQNKHAREMVISEIENHIEEQAEFFEEEGMSTEQAMTEAIKQMGDPVETGIQLNLLHRPKFPWLLFGIAAFLTIIGIIMQITIFQTVDNSYIVHKYPHNTIIYNLIGFGIIGVLLFFNYTSIVKYARPLYFAYLVGFSLLHLMIGQGFNFRFSFSSIYALYYFMWMFFPLIFGLLCYTKKEQGPKGILLCYGSFLLVMLLIVITYATASVITSGIVETFLVITAVMLLSVAKGFWGKPCAKLYVAAIAPAICAIFAGISAFFIFSQSGIGNYFSGRLSGLLERHTGIYSENNYVISVIADSMSRFTLFGTHTLPDEHMILRNDMYSTFMVHSIFSWYGILAGVIVIALMLGFGGYGLYISLRQNNRIGLILGSICSISILLRSVIYICLNLGLGLYYTITVPFLTYGLAACIMNSLYVGILLCVYRNTDTLAEPPAIPFRTTLQQ